MNNLVIVDSYQIYYLLGYKGEFKWTDYLKKTKSKAAPGILFHRVSISI